MLKAVNAEWMEIPLDRAIAAASRNVAEALEKVLAGNDLGLDEGLTLAKVEGNDLLALLKVADELRRGAVGDRVTYVVNRNLNFTNVCIVGCAFCGFSRGPDSPEAYFHSTDTLIAKSLEAVERGATEVCIQGGLPKDLNGYYYVELLRAIKARLPELHVHAYSPMEITYGVEKTRLPLREYLVMLKESGLGSIPGTAAEILDDDVRRSLSPNKLKVRQWIEVIRTAHSLGIPSTSTMMYGHTELPEHWVRHMLLLREIQKGVEGQGLNQAQAVFGYTRLMVAAFGLGGGWAALDRAIPYATKRIQAGAPLSEKQGYTHKLMVPHVARLEAGRASIEETAERIDAGEGSLNTEGAIAKYMSTEAGDRAADAAIQALGRLRLHPRVHGGKNQARCSHHHDLRRHLRDHGDDDQPRPLAASPQNAWPVLSRPSEEVRRDASRSSGSGRQHRSDGLARACRSDGEMRVLRV